MAQSYPLPHVELLPARAKAIFFPGPLADTLACICNYLLDYARLLDDFGLPTLELDRDCFSSLVDPRSLQAPTSSRDFSKPGTALGATRSPRDTHLHFELQLQLLHIL